MSSIPLLLLLLVLLLGGTSGEGKKQHEQDPVPSDLVRSSCVHASYPRVCLRSLAGSRSGSPREVAQEAVRVSLARARRVRQYLTGTSQSLGDCVELVRDSVDDLSDTLKELQHLNGDTFRWQMSNAETWVSAALTNQDTCLDSLPHQHDLNLNLNHNITNLAKLTANALYMINRLDPHYHRP